MELFNAYSKLIAFTIILFGSAQYSCAQLPWLEDFESGSGGFSISPAGVTYSDGSGDYLTITDGSTISAAVVYTGNATNYLAAQDLDGDGESNTQTLTWTGINISGCSSLSLSIDAAEDDDGSNQDWDATDYVHINYQIDGGGWQNAIWFEATGTNTEPLLDTDFNGTGEGTALTSAFQTFISAISGTGALIDIQIIIRLEAGDEDIAIDNISLTAQSCGGPVQTITTSNISNTTFIVDCSTGANGTIDLSSTGTFNSGNDYIIQLSDASGSFTSPTTLGSITSTANSENGVSFTIPAATISNSGYSIRIVSTDPVVISDTISPITVTLTGAPCVLIPPHMTSVIINSCNSACGEGNNELVFGNTGDYSLLVNETNFNFSYTNSGALNNYTDVLTNNSTTTQDINDLCPSSDPFIDAYGTTIPPNSSWVLANDAICPSDALDWSGLCNSGPIYIIYSTDSDWNLGGNFSNNPSAANPLRPYQTSMITTSGSTFTIDYETDGSLYPDNDGVFATFDYNGGSATGYGDNNCTFTPVVLPVELINFQGKQEGNTNELHWTTASERNASHYEVEVTSDGFNWELVGITSATGNSTEINTYQLDHYNPEKAINYYRLHQFDLDGANLKFTKIVTIDNRENSEELIGIFNTLGQEISGNEKGVQIYLYSDGSAKRVLKN